MEVEGVVTFSRLPEEIHKSLQSTRIESDYLEALKEE
jgi:hypothetical protein